MSKRQSFEAILARGSAFVHLDPRKSGVVVPSQFHNSTTLVLQFGYDLPIPVGDLEVNDVGVQGTLSFNRTPFTCFVPWKAIYAIVGDDGKGCAWGDDAPPEIAREVQRKMTTPEAPPPDKKIVFSDTTKSGRKLPPHLRIVR